MTVIDLRQRQIEHRAELLCQTRNKGVPVDIARSCFEPISGGVQFIRYHYKLDSIRVDYTSVVAKIEWCNEANEWVISIPGGEQAWQPYPYLPRSADLTAVIREIEKDPKSCFWS